MAATRWLLLCVGAWDGCLTGKRIGFGRAFVGGDEVIVDGGREGSCSSNEARRPSAAVKRGRFSITVIRDVNCLKLGISPARATADFENAARISLGI